MRSKEENKEYINKYRFIAKVERMKERKIVCNICNLKLAETLHHKDENHDNSQNSNLLPICKECHLEMPHQSDQHFGEELRIGEIRSKRAQNRVVTPGVKDNVSKCYNFSRIVFFKKGNLVIKTEVSIRVQYLFKDWGFERLKPQEMELFKEN